MKSKLKCPSCKSVDLTIEEHWKMTIEFCQVNGVIDRDKGEITDHKDPYKLTAICDNCNHRWVVRNAIQITCVEKK